MGRPIRKGNTGPFFSRRFYRGLCYLTVFAHIIASSIRIFDIVFLNGEMTQNQVLAFVCFNLATQFVILATLIVTKRLPE